MQEYQDVRKMTIDEEIISLFIDYPGLLEQTIIKEEYLDNECRHLFKTLKQEYSKNKSIIFERLIENKNFNSKLYLSLVGKNIYHSSKNIRLKDDEKYLIERYKKQQYEITIKNYKGDIKDFYEKLTKINELNYNENEYLKSERMIKVLSQKNVLIKLGYQHLDAALQLSRNDFLIIGGGTGTGKTAFALNLLCNLSEDYQCIYFNMEMSENIIYKRILSIMTGIEIKKFNDLETLTSKEKEILLYATKKIEERKIILVNKVATTNEIRKSISNIQTKKHIIAIIDHIGLIKGKGSNLYEKMTNIAKEIREISINNQTTIIGLCQLSRDSQKKEERPVLQDLRDSGEIEQSSRKALLLYNITPKEKNMDRLQNMEVIIAKNDDGAKIIKEFIFDRYTQTYNEKI